MNKTKQIRKEIERILFSDVGCLLKEIIYGKPLYNLEIRPKITYTGLSKENIDYLLWVQEQGYKRGYFGDHVVTTRGILMKGKHPRDQVLDKKIVDYDLGMLGNSADILNLAIIDRVPITDDHGFLNIQRPPIKVGACYPHIHLGNRIYDIKRTKLGLQLI